MYDQHAVDPKKKVQHIQTGEILRKYVSRRLLALSEGKIAALTTAMRQLGVEGLTIFHQLINDEWASGSLTEPLARIKVDEENCFGMIEWKAMREAASHFLPKHAAAAGWKHRKEVFPMPKDRGAEQGDVDGPLECSLALELVAKRVDAWLPSKRQAAFCGLVLMTVQKYSACKQNTQPSCRESPIFSWVDHWS